MNILFAAAEAMPLAKVGGLADVVGSLLQALSKLGHEVRLMLPLYGSIDRSSFPLAPAVDKFDIIIEGRRRKVALRLSSLSDKVPLYMVENDRYFGGKAIYQGERDLQRFLFFSRAVLASVPRLGWTPQIIHCHDWHTAPIPLGLKQLALPCASVFTIHNLAYQGAFDQHLLTAGLSEEWQRTPQLPRNMMALGILHADVVTTVSQNYAQEILTPEYGEGLDPLLRQRKERLFGITNGIDYEEYDPATDPHLVANYDASSLGKKMLNKLALQGRANLPQDAEAPLIGMVSRLEEQKGFDLLKKVIDPLLGEIGVQLVILGMGRKRYHDMLRRVRARYHTQAAILSAFADPLAHLIYAGCDMFLMPSRFEPCGLGQLIAMRYGTIPIVRHTGGLVDTVQDCSPDLERGNGFVFVSYEPQALLEAVTRAIAAFKRREAWQKLMSRAMAIDSSWEAPAKKYEAIYHKALSNY
jgi:starch synthase